MIDAALVILKTSPGLSDSAMRILLHRQMDGWMPTTMSDAEVDAVIRDAIAGARKRFEAARPLGGELPMRRQDRWIFRGFPKFRVSSGPLDPTYA